MKLARFQKLMAEDVMRPLTRQDGIARQNKAASYVRPNDRLTAVERLEIYNRSYWFRILDSLYEDFRGCGRWLETVLLQSFPRPI